MTYIDIAKEVEDRNSSTGGQVRGSSEVVGLGVEQDHISETGEWEYERQRKRAGTDR